MAKPRQGLHLQRNLADAFADILKAGFGITPKSITREADMDIRTARNALDGKAGAPFITRTLLHRQNQSDDHYDFALAMLAELFGETLDQYEERKLRALIESTENARDLAEARASRRRALDSRARTANGQLDRSFDRSGERSG